MAYTTEAPTTAEVILSFAGESFRNREIAKLAGCSEAYVSRTLKQAGVEIYRPERKYERCIPNTRRKRNVFSASRAAKRLRNAMAEYYETTADTDALDILEALCAVDEGLNKLWEEWA
jgi:hypothetical protein